LLGIEAGEKAWSHIEFGELHQTAVEFFDLDHVLKLKVSKDKSYIRQVHDFLRQNAVTHYLFDPRTGGQKALPGLWEAFYLGLIMSRRGVTPIAYCTDISERLGRAKAAIITSLHGVCVCFMSSENALRMFPHSRIIGPIPMPVSEKTVKALSAESQATTTSTRPEVSFFGSLYEPRITQLNEIKELLDEKGINFEFSGRQAGGPRTSNREYWRRLEQADILVTTASQIGGKHVDQAHVNQMVYRLTEGLVAQACVVMERAPGVEEYFIEGEDFVGWSTPSEAAALIEKLIRDPALVESIRRTGSAKIRRLVKDRFFWEKIISGLDSDQSS